MRHLINARDLIFLEEVERWRFPVADFDHRAHLRLAYIYFAKSGSVKQAVQQMKNALVALLKHAGIEPVAKYPETRNEVLILAVHRFMNKTGKSVGSDDFLDQHLAMLVSDIMLTHYSTEVPFSEKARAKFVEPNLDPIPRHGKLA